MFCPSSAVQTLATALTALGLINKVDLDGFDVTVELVGKPIAAASSDDADKGRLFAFGGNSPILFEFPRVSVDRTNQHYYTNTRFAVVLESRTKQNPGFQPYVDQHLALALLG